MYGTSQSADITGRARVQPQHTHARKELHTLLTTSAGETCLHLAARHDKAHTVYDLWKLGDKI